MKTVRINENDKDYHLLVLLFFRYESSEKLITCKGTIIMELYKQKYKLIQCVFVLICMLFSSNVFADYCYSKNTGSISSSKPGKYTQQIDLSDAFISTSKFSATYTSTWNHIIVCDIGTWPIYFSSPLTRPYYIHFTDPTGSNGYWMKLTSSLSSASTSTGKITTALTEKSLSLYPVNATVTAELVSNPGTSVDYYETTTGTAAVIIATIMDGRYVPNDADVRAAMINELNGGGYTLSRTYGVQYLNITYIPETMTCSINNQTIKMPVVNISDLASGKNDGEYAASIPVSCDSKTGNAISDVSIWLSSNDIVDNDNKIIRNDSSTSSGIGIKLKTTAGNDVSFSPSTSRENATEMLSIHKGSTLSSSDDRIDFSALYSIYDKTNLQVGSVTATATVMFSYD